MLSKPSRMTPRERLLAVYTGHKPDAVPALADLSYWHAGNGGGKFIPGKTDGANRDKVDALLAKLANMRASSFVESQAKTGLDKPALVVYAKFDDGKKEERISFGQADKDVYATIPGASGAAKTDAADFTEALKSLDEIAK